MLFIIGNGKTGMYWEEIQAYSKRRTRYHGSSGGTPTKRTLGLLLGRGPCTRIPSYLPRRARSAAIKPPEGLYSRETQAHTVRRTAYGGSGSSRTEARESDHPGQCRTWLTVHVCCGHGSAFSCRPWPFRSGGTSSTVRKRLSRADTCTACSCQGFQPGKGEGRTGSFRSSHGGWKTRGTGILQRGDGVRDALGKGGSVPSGIPSNRFGPRFGPLGGNRVGNVKEETAPTHVPSSRT
jgi:hypothetical protein